MKVSTMPHLKCFIKYQVWIEKRAKHSVFFEGQSLLKKVDVCNCGCWRGSYLLICVQSRKGQTRSNNKQSFSGVTFFWLLIKKPFLGQIYSIRLSSLILYNVSTFSVEFQSQHQILRTY